MYSGGIDGGKAEGTSSTRVYESAEGEWMGEDFWGHHSLEEEENEDRDVGKFGARWKRG